MKNVYKIYSLGLLITVLMGCENNKLYNALPKPVPLSMSINDKSFIMGETLKVNIKVNKGSQQNKEGTQSEIVAKEDIDIYFTAKNGTEDASGMFENFSSIVTFPKGEEEIQVSFPVKTSGLTGATNVEIAAWARGYKISDANQGIKVADFHRVTVSLDGNPENSVMENKTFVLVAKIDKPYNHDITIGITPKEGDKAYYKNLPEKIVILKGRTEAKSYEVTMIHDGVQTGDKDAVLDFTSDSERNPLNNNSLTIRRVDVESMSDPELIDMTNVYPNPDMLFVSDEADAWFGAKDLMKVISGETLHPKKNNWKFEYALEFHGIARCGVNGQAAGKGLGHANDSRPATHGITVDNNNSKVNTDGKLVMWANKKNSTGKYPVAAYQCAKMLNKAGSLNPLNHTRIYPGMRIEVKVLLRGTRTGFVPTIDIKDHKSGDGVSYGRNKSIVILENTEGNMVKQSVTGDDQTDNVTEEIIIPTIGDYNIYWMEMVDEETINIGINGKKTLSVTKRDLETWPFEKSKMETSDNETCNGLYMTMRMESSQALKDGTMSEGWDSYLNAITDFENEGPAMVIDWIRFYTNDSYVRTEKEIVYRSTLYY